MRKSFKVDPYEAKVHIIVDPDPVKVYNKLVKKYPGIGPKMEPGDYHGLAVWDENVGGDFWLILSPDPELGTIVHECFHLTIAICAFYGVKVKDDSEPPAYLMEFLFKNVARYLLAL